MSSRFFLFAPRPSPLPPPSPHLCDSTPSHSCSVSVQVRRCASADVWSPSRTGSKEVQLLFIFVFVFTHTHTHKNTHIKTHINRQASRQKWYGRRQRHGRKEAMHHASNTEKPVDLCFVCFRLVSRSPPHLLFFVVCTRRVTCFSFCCYYVKDNPPVRPPSSVRQKEKAKQISLTYCISFFSSSLFVYVCQHTRLVASCPLADMCLSVFHGVCVGPATLVRR